MTERQEQRPAGEFRVYRTGVLLWCWEARLWTKGRIKADTGYGLSITANGAERAARRSLRRMARIHNAKATQWTEWKD